MNPENTTLRNYLTDLVDLAAWSWLTDLAKQGKVLLLANNLDLVQVGLALAEDDISQVQLWLDDGWLHRPTEEQILAWDQEEAESINLVSSDASLVENLEQKLQFESLIVQPFVLAKTKSPTKKKKF
jgi:hypothetical protein